MIALAKATKHRVHPIADRRTSVDTSTITRQWARAVYRQQRESLAALRAIALPLPRIDLIGRASGGPAPIVKLQSKYVPAHTSPSRPPPSSDGTLTADQEAECRRLHEREWSIRRLAYRYGVQRSAVRRVLGMATGRTTSNSGSPCVYKTPSGKFTGRFRGPTGMINAGIYDTPEEAESAVKRAKFGMGMEVAG